MTSVFFYNKWRTLALKRRQQQLETSIARATFKIRQQNEELKKLDHLKSRFFANVSHELRTPLTLLLSPIESVLKSRELSNRNHTWLQMARQNSKRLLQLVNEILDPNQLESGKLKTELSQVVLFNFLKRIIASFQSHAESSRIELLFHYHLDKYLQVKLDIKKTETILINLLSNALKFTPAGGRVALHARDYQEYLQLKVQDNGRSSG